LFYNFFVFSFFFFNKVSHASTFVYRYDPSKPDREEFDFTAIQEELLQRWDQNELLENPLLDLQIRPEGVSYDEKFEHTEIDYTEYTIDDSYDDGNFTSGVVYSSTPIHSPSPSPEPTFEDFIMTISDESI
jgi:hypothetical protein